MTPFFEILTSEATAHLLVTNRTEVQQKKITLTKNNKRNFVLTRLS